MVSVIMPTFNTDIKMLSEAIDSILIQDYSDFELIVIDDGSNNYCNYEFVKNNYNDKRIVAVKNDNNLGVAKTLNRGLELAKGTIVFRMDADDIASPRRLSTVVEYYEKHPNVSVVGSYALTFGASKTVLQYPITNIGIRIELLYNNPFCHPTVSIRKSILDKYDLRYPTDVAKEDYNMWVSMSKYQDIVFANIPELLLNYRIHQNQITQKKQKILEKDAIFVVKKALAFFGVNNWDDITINNYVKTNYNNTKLSDDEFRDAIKIYESIMEAASSKSKPYELAALKMLSVKIKKVYIKQNTIYHANLNYHHIPQWLMKHTNSLTIDIMFLLSKFKFWFCSCIGALSKK